MERRGDARKKDNIYTSSMRKQVFPDETRSPNL